MNREERKLWLERIKEACAGNLQTEEDLVMEGRVNVALALLLVRLMTSTGRVWHPRGSSGYRTQMILESICEGIEGYSRRMYDDLDRLALAASEIMGGYYEEREDLRFHQDLCS